MHGSQTRRKWNSVRHPRAIALASAAMAVMAAVAPRVGRAASATWSSTPTDGFWEAMTGEVNWSTGDGTFPGDISGGTTSTDIATFSGASTITSIAINSSAGNSSPLNIGGISFQGNNKSAYTIGSVDGNALWLTSNANATSTTLGIGISNTFSSGTGNLETVNAPIVLLPQTSSTAGFYVFQNNDTGTAAAADVLVINGSVAGGTTTQGITLTLRGNNTNATNTVAGVISDGGAALGVAVVKSDAGTWTLTGANTYTGGTNVSGGTLSLGSSGALGTTGNINFTSGALQYTASNTTDYSPRIASGTSTGAVGIDTNGQNVTFATGLQATQTGGLTKLGLGTLTLTGVNAYTGNTTISGGTLKIDGAGQLGSGSYSGRIADNAGFLYNSSAAQTLSGVISGTGSVSATGSGTLALTGSNYFSGGTTVSGGDILAVTGLGVQSPGSISSTTTSGTATVTVTSASNIYVGATVSGTGIATGTTVAAINGTTITLSQNATGSGTNNLTYTPPAASSTVQSLTTNATTTATVGSATGLYVGQVVNGTNVPAGTTITAINGTTLTLSAAATGSGTNNTTFGQANAAGIGTLVVNGGTLQYTGSGQTSNRIFTIGDNNATLDGSGTGALTLNATPAFATANAARTLTLTGTYGSGSNTNILSASLADNGTGAFSIVKNGTGIWQLNSSTSTFSGGVTVNGGELQIGTGSTSSGGAVTRGPLGTGTLTINNGTAITTRGGGRTVGNAVVVNGNFIFNNIGGGNGNTLTLSGPVDLGGGTRTVSTYYQGAMSGIVSDGGLVKDSAPGAPASSSTLTLSGVNTYAGGTAVNAGTLVVGGSGTLGTGLVQVGASTVSANTGPVLTLSNASAIADSASLNFYDGSTINLNAANGTSETVAALFDLSTNTSIPPNTYTAAQLNSFFNNDNVFATMSGETLTVAAAPEPTSLLLAGVVAAPLLAGRRRRKGCDRCHA